MDPGDRVSTSRLILLPPGPQVQQHEVAFERRRRCGCSSLSGRDRHGPPIGTQATSLPPTRKAAPTCSSAFASPQHPFAPRAVEIRRETRRDEPTTVGRGVHRGDRSVLRRTGVPIGSNVVGSRGTRNPLSGSDSAVISGPSGSRTGSHRSVCRSLTRARTVRDAHVDAHDPLVNRRHRDRSAVRAEAPARRPRTDVDLSERLSTWRRRRGPRSSARHRSRWCAHPETA